MLARLVVAALLGATSAAAAPGPKELATARRLFAEAEKAEQAERWAEALDKLEQVAAIKQTAGVRFHIAVCQSHLGLLVESIESFERAQDLAREQKADDVLGMVAPKLEEVRRRVPVLHVRIPETVRGAVVTINGKPVDPAQLGAIPLNPGTHQLIIRVDGQDRVDRYVTLADGGQDTVELKASAPPTPVPAPPQHSPATSEVPVQTSSSRVPVHAWVALGTGAALGLGGYLAYRRADSLASDSADVCAQSIKCDSARIDAVRRWDGAALGLWIGAAASVGTGIAFIATHNRSSSDDVALVVFPDSVALRGSFR